MKKLFFVSAFLIALGLNVNAQTGKANSKEITTVTYNGKTFTKGDRIRVMSYAGTAKYNETGHNVEIKVDEGRTGTVICGKKREATDYFKPDPKEPIQIVLVKWDEQEWKENNQAGKKVKLKPFESTIHLDYLEVVK